MNKSIAKKLIYLSAALLLLVIAYLAFSRPMSIESRYPMLSLDRCTGISGYWRDASADVLQKFTLDKDSEEFQSLCELLYAREYRRSLRDLLPRGTRTHQPAPEDFQWEVSFRFEDITLPDGSIGSGEMLRIQYWYGELDLYFDGGQLSCKTAGQDEWAKQVLDIIQ